MDKKITYCPVCGRPDDECICYDDKNTNADMTLEKFLKIHTNVRLSEVSEPVKKMGWMQDTQQWEVWSMTIGPNRGPVWLYKGDNIWKALEELLKY